MAKPYLGFLLAVPLALVGGCAASAGNTGAQSANAPAAQTAAKQAGGPQTVDCIDLIRIDRTEVLDDQTILFHMKGGKIWRNRLPYKCPQLGFEKAFSHKTTISRLCSIDTITVLNTTARMPGATCGLGEFEAYTPPPKGEKGDAAKPEGESR
ncbi:DUF6491 family protein [Pedomonas mirosovicensis]|uniref:DUF6491 family protein n=1 Tax=Pedomonas mirosovicensis TaxID=2908641 RepID=UPI002167F99C|nr:DUF6491 family protein [Pedomonas mirosovicensis]MCH8683891.1 DUF6491 family protein [Pedomonas mirosovicensis]